MKITRRSLMQGTALVAPFVRPAAGEQKFLAGAATSNITPPLGCSLAGMKNDRIGTEVHDELHARCLVLDDGGTRLAFAVVDSCMVPGELIQRAKQLIQQHTAIPPSHVMISATHSHTAPAAAHLFQSHPDPKYNDFLVARIADGVQRAVNHLAPARIGCGVGREDRLAVNRRWLAKPGAEIPPDPWGRKNTKVVGTASPDRLKPTGPIDPDVSVIAVQALDGRPIALLTSYSLHYVGGTGKGHISADYFGAWADAVGELIAPARERLDPPFVPMLANGCAGNINSTDVMMETKAYLAAPPYSRIRRSADILAAECYRTWRAMEFQDWAQLGAVLEELELGVRLPSAEEVAAARKILDGVPKTRDLRGNEEIYAGETVSLAEGWPPRMKVPVQALRIGSSAVVTFACEAFVEMGLEVKAKSPFQPTIAIELANGCHGYVPTPQAFELGGYETFRAKTSYLERDAAPKLVASALQQLQALKRG